MDSGVGLGAERSETRTASAHLQLSCIMHMFVGPTKDTATMPTKKPNRTRRKSKRKPDRHEVRAHPDAELSAKQVRELHDKLVAERTRVRRGLEQHLSEATRDLDPLPDEADQASRSSEQAYLIRFADKERKLLREIDYALERLKTGDYGVCLGSDEPIGFRRLSLRPWTRYSIAYKEELEHEKRQHVA